MTTKHMWNADGARVSVGQRATYHPFKIVCVLAAAFRHSAQGTHFVSFWMDPRPRQTLNLANDLWHVENLKKAPIFLMIFQRNIRKNRLYLKPDPATADKIWGSLCVCTHLCVCICVHVCTCWHISTVAELLPSRRCCSELNLKAWQSGCSWRNQIQQVHLTDWGEAAAAATV